MDLDHPVVRTADWFVRMLIPGRLKFVHPHVTTGNVQPMMHN